jgi:glycosyl transferase family 25
MNGKVNTSQVRVLVVSLRECHDRRSELSRRARAAVLDFEYVDAVDILDEEVLQLAQAHRESPLPNPGARRLGVREIACALSHRRIYEKAVAECWSGCLILEDDAGFDSALPAFIKCIEQSSAALADIPLMIYLGGREGFEHRILVLSIWRKLSLWRGGTVRKVVASEKAIQRTCGYYVTRGACLRILAEERDSVIVADAWDARLKDGTLSEIWVTTPPLVTHPESNDGSLIEYERRLLINEYASLPKQQRSRFSLWKRAARLLKRKLIYPALSLLP